MKSSNNDAPKPMRFTRDVNPYPISDDLRSVQASSLCGAALDASSSTHYDVHEWLKGDPLAPKPPDHALGGPKP